MARIYTTLLFLALLSTTANAQSFQQVLPVYETGSPYGLDTGDLDGDGDLDLVAAFRGASAGQLNMWYLNDGNGTLTAGGNFPFYADNSMGAATADFDGDGRLDVVFANAYANNDSCGSPDACDENVVYLNIGDQTPPSTVADFATLATWRDGVADASWDVEAADLNGDGAPDFVIASVEQSRIWINDDVGLGSVSFTELVVPGLPVIARGVTVAELNNDGYNDIVFANGAVLLSTTLAGAFDGFMRSTPDLTGTTNRVESGDLDGDLDIDLVFVGNYSQNRVYLNDGTGSFSPTATFGPATNPRFESDLADINDDGIPDLIAAGFQAAADPFDFFQLGNGDGTFAQAAVAGFSGRFSVEIADLNGDGNPDITTSDPSSVWLNTISGDPLLVTNTNDSGSGSLRAAIEFANASPDPSEQITFDIPGAGPHMVALQSELVITDPVVIDGLSQPGAVCGADVAGHDLRIVLDGSLVPNGGVRVSPPGSGSTIQGLVLSNFSGLTVTLDGTTGSVVRCNYLGTDETGTSVRELGSTAVQISGGANNVIGGPSPSDGNLISGFAGLVGISVSGSSGAVVQNNVVGLTADATTVLRPTVEGLVGISTFFSSSTIIADNVIGGFPLFGIEFQFETDSEISNNFIGTNQAGDPGLGNALGILLQKETTGSLIVGNTIANNGSDGISVISGRDQLASISGESTGNTISMNAIRNNGGSGIDLGATVVCDAGTTLNCTGGLWPAADGPTPNDAGDVDTGSNGLQNYPEIVRAEINAADELIILYSVDTDDPGALSAEFFAADASSEEGSDFLAGDTYSDSPGTLKQTVFSGASGLGVSVGDDLLATITDTAGNTSEFSAPAVTVAESGTFVVTTSADTGPGSLREAITLANQIGNGVSGPDQITFAIPGGGPHVITPLSGLPLISDPVEINGTSQAGATCGTVDISDRDLRIVLDGSSLLYSSGSANPDGLTVAENTDDVSIRGLVIHSFPGAGVFVRSGNSGGVFQCNNIGTDAAGLAPLGNYGAGIQIVGYVADSNNNLIGGPSLADGNLIAANGYNEVHFEPGAVSNTVRNNLIGTDASGTAIIQAPDAYFSDPSIDDFSNLTGVGSNQGEGNLITENVVGGFGIGVGLASNQDAVTEAFFGGLNIVSANYLGTDRSGSVDLGNGTAVSIGGNGQGVETVGGPQPSDGNIIRYNGVGVEMVEPPDIVVQNNTIDLNSGDGIVAVGGINHTIAGNQIDSNSGVGILLGPGSSASTVFGNNIGLSASGNVVEAEGVPDSNLHGIVISDSPDNVIGLVGAPNILSGNRDAGIVIEYPGSTDNIVQANFVGTDATGLLDRGNQFDGLKITFGATQNLVGGDSADQANVISGNGTHGVSITAPNPSDESIVNTDNTVSGNIIGLGADGETIVGNGFAGVWIERDSRANTVSDNVVSGNVDTGIVMTSGASDNVIRGNIVGLNADQSAARGNVREAVAITVDAANNTVVGNVLSGNGIGGIILVGQGPGNVIQDNVIGTNAGGSAPFGNGGPGIRFESFGSTDVLIGGTGPGESNTIAFNAGAGISIEDFDGAPFPGATISGNSIRENAGLGIDLGGDGFTVNDEGDPDDGPNGLANFPTVTSASLDAGLTALSVSVFIDAAFPVTVEVFSADADGEEGAFFLGDETFAGSPGPRSLTLPAGAVSTGDLLVATATDANGFTSEFSLPAEVSAGQSIILLPDQRVVQSDILTFQLDPDLNSVAGISSAISSAISTIQGVQTSTAGTRIGFGGWSSGPVGPSVNDGINAVTKSGSAFPLSANTLAVASKLLYTNVPGQEARIVEADIVFNANLLGQADGIGTDLQPGIWDAQAIALHEFVHSVGGRHLGTATATQFFSIPSGKSYRTLEADDIAQLTAMYPSALASTTFGQISGRVLDGESGTLGPIAGALVVARHVTTSARISAYSDVNGDYTIYGLKPGEYSVSIQPLDGFVDNIPGMTAGTVSQYLASIANNATFFEEVHSGANEGANEEPDTFQPVAVSVGSTTTGIDFITNVDLTAPTVNGTTPTSARASIRPEIAVTFSETITTANLSIELVNLGNGVPVNGTVGVANGQSRIATFSLATGASLEYSRMYEIRVSGQTDIKGNTNNNVFTSTFTTRPVDTIPPSVVSVVPSDGATGIAPDASIAVTFSEPMDQTSIEAGLVLSCVSGPAGSACPGAVNGTFDFPAVIGVEPNYVVVFTPDVQLSEDAVYELSFAPTISDAGGANPIGAVSPFSFETQPNAAPVVIDFGPINGASNVSIRTSVFADFSERMTLPASDAILLTGPGGPVAGRSELLNDGRRVIFRPDVPLAYSTGFMVEISSAFTDASIPPEGLASPPVFSFTTAPTPPVVSIESVSPVVAIPGAVVALGGSGFSAVPADNMVTFSGASGPIPVEPESSTLNTISVVVPDGAVAGPVTVTVSGSSDSIDLELYDVLPLLDPAVSRTTAESAPRDVEVTPDGGTAFVSNTGSNSISVLDVDTGALIQSILVGDSPMKVALSPDGSRLYVSNFGSHNVSEIDVASLTVVRTIDVGLNPYGLAISPDGKRLYVAEYTSRKISIIDIDQDSGTANRAIARITVESTQRDVDEFPDGGTVVGVESNPRDVEVSPDGGALFFTTQGLGLRVLVLDTNGSASEDAGTLRITSERNTRDVEVSPDGGVVWVTTLAGALEGYRIPASLASNSSFSAVARLGEDTNAREVEVSPDGGLLYVTNFDLGVVTIYSISSQVVPSTNSALLALTLTPVESIVVGENPEAVVFSPIARAVIVVNSGSDDISVLKYDAPDDIDGDGLSDGEELAGGTDPNNPDTDGDTFEDGSDDFPLDPTEWEDQDGDGTGDNTDLDDDGNRVHDARQMLVSAIETLITDRNPDALSKAGKKSLETPEGWTWESADELEGSEVQGSSFDFVLLRLFIARAGLIENADPDNWVDSLHVEQSFGLEMFIHSKRAVDAFQAMGRKGSPSLDVDLLSRIVVDLEAQLTDTAIEEIECGRSWGCRLALRLAEYYRESAEREISREDWDDAVVDLAKAWSYAQIATEAAGKGGETAGAFADDVLPIEFDLSPNYPNPFNPATTLEFALPEASNVSIMVYDMLGRQVATILDDELEAGFHRTQFDASSLPSGMYVYRMVAGDFVKVRTMTLVK